MVLSFSNILFIKRSVEQKQNKKSVIIKRNHKNVITKSVMKVSQVKYTKKLTSRLYFEALVLTPHCYCGDNVKYGLLPKHLFQIKQ